ncbi:hypothetical protein L3C95_30160 [Chitinophaga filiformis]|uniref:hypothetical protein n=1 Tax=Chitinophaga filiformis TaxID=104663 RepID=UPI001F3D311B|nr:hypothetical protein [Chitinophaga filiformis]MCF6407199.1 hypothetical protein [Chitinophaga filiformis]
MLIKPLTTIPEIQSGIRTIEENIELYEDNNFNLRADTLDFIDFHIIGRIEELLLQTGETKDLQELNHHAETLKCRLEEIDGYLFNELREKIRAGIYTGSSFTEMVTEYLGYDVVADEKINEIGYDNLDIFLNGLLLTGNMPEALMEPEPEMVFYQKTPARMIFALSASIKPTDVFVDVGSGLGQVNMLVNLISGAVSVGIEWEPAYADYATACGAALNLTNVAFVNTDARKADFSSGTIFFMYTPFLGNMMQDVLCMLKQESEKRPISIFTYGPCSALVARQEWLTCVKGRADDPHKLYEFRNVEVKQSSEERNKI